MSALCCSSALCLRLYWLGSTFERESVETSHETAPSLAWGRAAWRSVAYSCCWALLGKAGKMLGCGSPAHRGAAGKAAGLGFEIGVVWVWCGRAGVRVRASVCVRVCAWTARCDVQWAGGLISACNVLYIFMALCCV